MKGNTGKILHVNLTQKKVTVEEPEEKQYRKYFGGACMGAYYALKHIPAGIDPLSEENVLIFTVSGLTGAAVSGTARHCVTAKSPQTNTLASSEAGGFWAPELKFAGFDGIVIYGKAENPVYLWIHNGQCEIREADKLWGRDTRETQTLIRKELEDQKVRIAQIGVGGEKLVTYAGIVNELKHFNGRNGLGAVMGSKNLKAIAVRGNIKPDFHEKEIINKLARKAVEVIKENDFYQLFKQHGTTLNVEWNGPAGGLPTRNWEAGNFEEEKKLTAAVYADEMMDEPGTCWGCVQKCKRDIKSGIEFPEKINPEFGGPEYETIGMCGSNLGISDLNTIAAINQLASRYCIDTISLGGVLGFAMECYQQGVIGINDLDGIDLTFGNGNAALSMAKKIAERDGVGDLLAQGTRIVAEAWGVEAEYLAVHVKGKEFPAHMPHAKASLALAYACNGFGPDHVSSEHDGAIAADIGEDLISMGFYETQNSLELTLEKGKFFAYTQRIASAIDSVSTCSFIFNTWAMLGFDDLLELIKAATGWNYTMFEFMLLGERRVNMVKAFNTREGFTSKEDDLPARLFEKPITSNGATNGKLINREDFLKAREYYYAINGWDKKTGIPDKYKLMELGLEWALNFIEKM